MNVHNWKIFQMWTFTIGRSSKWVFTKISKAFEMNFWWRPSHFFLKKYGILDSPFFSQKACEKDCWISVLLNLQKLISWFFCKRRRPTLFLPLNLDENFTKVVPQTEIEYLLLLGVVEITKVKIFKMADQEKSLENSMKTLNIGRSHQLYFDDFLVLERQSPHINGNTF